MKVTRAMEEHDNDQQLMQRLRDEWHSRAGQERSLKVRWLMNPNEEPQRGVEIVEQSGVIVDVRPLADWQADDIWPVIATPPLINCHTHLEFSSISESLTPSNPFPEWIRSLMQWRREQPENPSRRAIELGMKESQAAGVAAIGEITTGELTDLSSCYSEDDQGPAIASFREAIGLRPGRIQEQLETARRHLSTPVPSSIIRGLSPHAPYTVHPDLLSGLALLAREHQAPLAMHLAETRDELQLLEHGTGRLAEFLKSLDLFDSSTFPGGRCVRECLEQLCLAPRSLVVHGNYLNDDDVSWLRGHPQCTVVYCPRTHSYFGHDRYPLERYMAADTRITLGTDSRASNPDLSLWREVQYVAQTYPELTIGTLISFVTTNATEALGLDQTPLRAVVSLMLCRSESSSPHEAILDSDSLLSI
jgi:cytosine/adenosine deaminase-related metal-dependent hydrolase